MKRRNSADRRPAGDPTERAAGDDRPLGPAQDWSRWSGTWEEGEQERVARWLSTKGRSTPVGERDPWAPAGNRVDGVAPVEMATPHTGRREVAPGRDDVRSVLEAQVAYLEGERGRLSAAVRQERAEAERVRREQLVARSLLEAEIAALDDERRHALASAEAARAAAQRALQEEREARAAMDAAYVEARRAEARHFDVWAGLEVEVAAMKAQRRRLRALRRRHRRH